MEKIIESFNKLPISQKMRKITLFWVSVIILISVLTFITWLLSGADFSFALTRFISVIIAGCPLGLILSTPITLKNANKIAKDNGISFRIDGVMENAGKAKIITLNKTGTITEGVPTVTDVFTADHFSSSGYSIGGISEDELLETAALLESRSNNALSKAIVRYTNELIIEPNDEIESYKEVPGKGIEAMLNGVPIRGGDLDFIIEKAIVSEEIKLRAKELSAVGKTPIFYSKGKRLLGIIAVVDTVKDEAATTISELKRLGLNVVMFTGNLELTTTIIGTVAGVDEILSVPDPDAKENAVKELSKKGRVIVFSENYNDSRCLLEADTGIIPETQNLTFLDAADIVVSRNAFKSLPGIIRLSRLVLNNIQVNVLLSFIFSIVCVFFACGISFSRYKFAMDPLESLLILCITAITIIINSSMLRFKDIKNSFKDEYTNNYTNG